jgi:hypothetical protein
MADKLNFAAEKSQSNLTRLQVRPTSAAGLLSLPARFSRRGSGLFESHPKRKYNQNDSQAAPIHPQVQWHCVKRPGSLDLLFYSFYRGEPHARPNTVGASG